MSLISAIRKQVKTSFDNIRNEKIKLSLWEAIPFWTGSFFVGLIAVAYAKLFAITESGSSFLFHHYKWMFLCITPLCFIIAWWLIKQFAPYARGSGIPQVMAAIELATPKHNEKLKKLLSLRIIFIKIVSSIVLVFGGGAIGREGPTIQIAGSVFRKINLWLPDWWPKISKRNMIMAGAAAGLAAAFNTPLGGIVFAVEELTKTHISYFKTAIFTSVIIAGLTAQWLMGSYLYLGYPVINQVSPYIIIAIILVAIVCGIAGSSMTKIILAVLKWKSNFKTHQIILFLLASAILLSLSAIFIDENIFGSGKGLMTQVLFTHDVYVHWYSPLLRICGPILSFTSGASGGVFAPALSAGASIGSVFSGWMHLNETNTHLLVLSGMVAFLTGVTRTPFTSAILVLEMTDRHNVIFYLMLAGMVASIVAVIIDKRSFYDRLKHQYMQELTHEIH